MPHRLDRAPVDLPIDPADLNEDMSALAEHLGLDAVLYLCRRHPIDTLYVPSLGSRPRPVQIEHLKPGSWLHHVANEQGMPLARVLVELFGGTMLYIPSLDELKRHAEERHIARLYNGQNAHELSQQFGVSRRQIRRIARRRS